MSLPTVEEGKLRNLGNATTESSISFLLPQTEVKPQRGGTSKAGFCLILFLSVEPGNAVLGSSASAFCSAGLIDESHDSGFLPSKSAESIMFVNVPVEKSSWLSS